MNTLDPYDLRCLSSIVEDQTSHDDDAKGARIFSVLIVPEDPRTEMKRTALTKTPRHGQSCLSVPAPDFVRVSLLDGGSTGYRLVLRNISSTFFIYFFLELWMLHSTSTTSSNLIYPKNVSLHGSLSTVDVTSCFRLTRSKHCFSRDRSMA